MIKLHILVGYLTPHTIRYDTTMRQETCDSQGLGVRSRKPTGLRGTGILF